MLGMRGIAVEGATQDHRDGAFRRMDGRRDFGENGAVGRRRATSDLWLGNRKTGTLRVHRVGLLCDFCWEHTHGPDHTPQDFHNGGAAERAEGSPGRFQVLFGNGCNAIWPHLCCLRQSGLTGS
jgi:hypothetical protein